MNRKLDIRSVVIILLMLSVSSFSNVAIANQIPNVDLYSKIVNRQVYLGSAKIIGNGNINTLEAVAENDFSIGIGSQSSYVDFYIDYNMTCKGELDEGVIVLVLVLNGANISINLTIITPLETYKNGTLRIENVEVERGDLLGFWIEVVYAWGIPPEYNETKAYGAGAIIKTITVIEKSTNLFLRFLDNHPRIFPMTRHILGL